MSLEHENNQRLKEFDHLLSNPLLDTEKRHQIEQARTNYLIDLGRLVAKYSTKQQAPCPLPKPTTRPFASPGPTCRVKLELVPGGPWILPLDASVDHLTVLLVAGTRKIGMCYSFQAVVRGRRLPIVHSLDEVAIPGHILKVAWMMSGATLLGGDEPLLATATFVGPSGNFTAQVPLEATTNVLESTLRSNKLLPPGGPMCFWVGKERLYRQTLRHHCQGAPLHIRYAANVVEVRRITHEAPPLLPIKSTKNMSRSGSMYRDYLKIVGHVRTIKPETDHFNCEICGSPLLRLSGALVCPGYDVEEVDIDGNVRVAHRDCGFQISVLTNGVANVPYSTKLEVSRRSCYQRANHFREWLAQIQAKQRTEIPLCVLQTVAREFIKYRMHSSCDITKQRVRQFLKDLDRAHSNTPGAPKFSKYYEHAPLIAATLSAVPPPTMAVAQERKLVALFERFQVAFEECPSSIKGPRKNCLSYGFVLYKLCELCRYDEFLPLFPLLKSLDRLQTHDRIWKWVCGHLGWEFIPSI